MKLGRERERGREKGEGERERERGGREEKDNQSTKPSLY